MKCYETPYGKGKVQRQEKQQDRAKEQRLAALRKKRGEVSVEDGFIGDINDVGPGGKKDYAPDDGKNNGPPYGDAAGSNEDGAFSL